MIVLDAHVWVWWVQDDPLLPPDHKQVVQDHEAMGLGVSAISCWEVAKLVEYGRLTLPDPVEQWMAQALAYPGVRLLPVTPEIAIESTQLPAAISQRPGRSDHRGDGAGSRLRAGEL